MKVIVEGKTIEMTYEEICHKLGYRPEVGFIDVNKKGEIEFTIAKPDEILPLLTAVTREKMRPSYSLLRHCGYRSHSEYYQFLERREEEEAYFIRRYGKI